MTKRGAFRQSEVSAAVKGAQKAGLQVARVEVDQEGKIVIITGAEESSPAPTNSGGIVL